MHGIAVVNIRFFALVVAIAGPKHGFPIKISRQAVIFLHPADDPRIDERVVELIGGIRIVGTHTAVPPSFRPQILIKLAGGRRIEIVEERAPISYAVSSVVHSFRVFARFQTGNPAERLAYFFFDLSRNGVIRGEIIRKFVDEEIRPMTDTSRAVF